MSDGMSVSGIGGGNQEDKGLAKLWKMLLEQLTQKGETQAPKSQGPAAQQAGGCEDKAQVGAG